MDTQNYLIHYDKRLENKTATAHQLFELHLRLMLLVEACLLSQLGFDSEKITFLIEQSRFAKGMKN